MDPLWFSCGFFGLQLQSKIQDILVSIFHEGNAEWLPTPTVLQRPISRPSPCGFDITIVKPSEWWNLQKDLHILSSNTGLQFRSAANLLQEKLRFSPIPYLFTSWRVIAKDLTPIYGKCCVSLSVLVPPTPPHAPPFLSMHLCLFIWHLHFEQRSS